MSVNRTPELLEGLQYWYEVFEEFLGKGMRSLRAQWDIEGHAEPLTLYANRSGVFIVEPASQPVPAGEWLTREAVDAA